jgi:flagellar basal-body rod protein FlgB
MALDFFHDPTIQAMGSYMGRLSQRLEIINSNLSNGETPGYKTNDVAFHATMQELLAENSVEIRNTDSRHIQGMMAAPMKAQPFEVQGLESGLDGNNVDLDKEMLKLGETSFGYAFVTQMIKSKFRTLAMSISEGRG